jgi:hypothetical protein
MSKRRDCIPLLTRILILSFIQHGNLSFNQRSYDLRTQSWERVTAEGYSPPPRGYAMLRADPENADVLWLIGGKGSYSSNDCLTGEN